MFALGPVSPSAFLKQSDYLLDFALGSEALVLKLFLKDLVQLLAA
jgi:hypothetical protein